MPNTISKEKFQKVFYLCRAYDPFYNHIEDYKQLKSSERSNNRIMKQLNELLSEYGLAINFIPTGVDRSVSNKEACSNLTKWFKDNNVNAPESRIWTADEIKELVSTNDKVLYGALKQLYSQQTLDEQNAGETHHFNGAGFNGVDSRFLSSISEFLIKNGFLTPKQKAATRKKLVKYTGQLTRLANSK